MTESAVLFLGIMAVALVLMAVAQIGLMLVGLKVARQLTETAEQLRREVQPLLGKAEALTEQATRVTTLALAQVERVDALVATSAARVDDTMAVLQGIVAGPGRQGSAVLAAFRAAMSVVRDFQDRKQAARDTEEDALFVG